MISLNLHKAMGSSEDPLFRDDNSSAAVRVEKEKRRLIGKVLDFHYFSTDDAVVHERIP